MVEAVMHRDHPSSFSFVIDFEPNAPDPGRVFRAAYDLIDTFQQMDAELASVIDPGIKTILVLERVEAGSLRVFLKNIIENVEDEALLNLDWRPLLGRYLVKGKYKFLDLFNRMDEVDGRRPFIEASQEIAELAASTDVKRLPDYKPPQISSIARLMRLVSDAKSVLGPKDRVRLESEGEPTAHVNMGVTVTEARLDSLLTRESIERPPALMILRVKRPDLLGNAKWEFRHGRHPISAKITDEDWLGQFRSRGVVVRPGDALRCRVVEETHYGYDNEVISNMHTVIEVLEVIEGDAPHPEFDFDEA